MVPDHVHGKKRKFMIFPFLERCTKNGMKFPRKILGQTYNGTNLLVFTPLLRYYVNDLGIEITHIHEFVQYVPGLCFQPFTSKGEPLT